ncbi:hypothetical protein HispidOSU_023073 [Sigmodon hispidus]
MLPVAVEDWEIAFEDQGLQTTSESGLTQSGRSFTGGVYHLAPCMSSGLTISGAWEDSSGILKLICRTTCVEPFPM